MRQRGSNGPPGSGHHRWRGGRCCPTHEVRMPGADAADRLIARLSAARTAAGLRQAELAGLVWVPHGWGADDKSGFIHFVVRSCSCYAAYLFAPDNMKTAAIAGVVALAYIYAMAAMKKPASAR